MKRVPKTKDGNQVVATINGKIPSQASTSNQLADKDFVNSSISTQTAYFDGTWNTYADIPSTSAGFVNAGYPAPTNNNEKIQKAAGTDILSGILYNAYILPSGIRSYR